MTTINKSIALALLLYAPFSGAAVEVISVDPRCSDITWKAPTKREDGQDLALSEIKEFVIYYGRRPRVYDGAKSANGLSMSCADLGLLSGSYYIAGITIDTDGLTSQLSNEITKVIMGKPNAPVLGGE